MTDKEMDAMIASERRAYQKEWRAKNKDKVQQHNRNFYLKRAAAKLAEQQRESNDENKD